MPTDNTLTMRQIAEGWAVSNPTARKRLEGVSPARTQGNSKHYHLRDVVLALAVRTDEVNREDMEPRDRKDLADAELKEMRMQRMDAEQVDAKDTVSLFASAFKGIADLIKSCPDMPPIKQRELCKHVRGHLIRIADDVDSVKFPDAGT